jgi:TetR/AcrR family transcriptional repressor of nem operon
MARHKSYLLDDVVDAALLQFWHVGFNGLSIDDLVRATGTSRSALYAEFGSKRGLYLACFPRYRTAIVDPAFSQVETPVATLAEVGRYFEYQIAKAEERGLPGLGCFVGNAATETAPHDGEVRRAVQAHNHRLRQGFAAALIRSAPAAIPEQTIAGLAEGLVIFAGGLWSMARVAEDAGTLRAAVADMMRMVEKELRDADR